MKKGKVSQKSNKRITPCLWFNRNAKEAVNFYTSVFKNSKITNVTYYTESSSKASGMPVGSILTINFKLNGQEYVALNGGPIFKFTEAVSLMVECKDQKEIDYYWNKLSKGGDKKAQACGWLKDKYGLSWQIFPSIMTKVLKDKNQKRQDKVMEVMCQMKKLNVKALEKAYRS